MGIETCKEYVDFYLNLKMGNEINLQNFIRNEKRILKSKLENKNSNKKKLEKGIEILNKLNIEIIELGEKEVLKEYGK